MGDPNGRPIFPASVARSALHVAWCRSWVCAIITPRRFPSGNFPTGAFRHCAGWRSVGARDATTERSALLGERARLADCRACVQARGEGPRCRVMQGRGGPPAEYREGPPWKAAEHLRGCTRVCHGAPLNCIFQLHLAEVRSDNGRASADAGDRNDYGRRNARRHTYRWVGGTAADHNSSGRWRCPARELSPRLEWCWRPRCGGAVGAPHRGARSAPVRAEDPIHGRRVGGHRGASTRVPEGAGALRPRGVARRRAESAAERRERSPGSGVGSHRKQHRWALAHRSEEPRAGRHRPALRRARRLPAGAPRCGPADRLKVPA